MANNYLDVPVRIRDRISAEQQQEVRDATRAIHICMDGVVRNLMEIGRHLVAVREIIEHGEFQFWIREEFGLTERKAQHLMNIYRRLGEKSDILQILKPTALYYLSMPSTPYTAISAIESLLLEGKQLKVKEVIAIVEAHKRPKLSRTEYDVPVATRLAKTFRKVRAALNNQTLADCGRLLGEDNAENLGEVRVELDRLFQQIQRRTSPTDQETTLTHAIPALPYADNIQVIDGTLITDNRVVPGCTVCIRERKTGQDALYTIVVDEEGAPEQGRLNVNSPVAMALIGKSIGENVSVDTPDGEIHLTIVDIRFPADSSGTAQSA